MIIKRIAKLCRAARALGYTYAADEMWAGTSSAMYALTGIPAMSPDELKNVYDWNTAAKTAVTAREAHIEPIIRCAQEIRLSNYCCVQLGNDEYRVFQDEGRLHFIRDEYFAPLADIPPDELYYFAVRHNGAEVLIVKHGFVPVAVLVPYRPSEGELQGYIELHSAQVDMIRRYLELKLRTVPDDDGQMELGDGE